MKVLQVNCVYGSGSTGKIVREIHAGLLNEGIESVVCYGRGTVADEDGVYKVCGELYSKANQFYARVRGQLYGGCKVSTLHLINMIEREKPDIVHLQCINGYFVNIYKLIGWLKQKRIKTVLTLHAEFMYTANCGHARECERWKIGCGSCPQLKTDIRSYGIDGTAKSWRKMCEAFKGFKDCLRVVSVSPWLMMRAMQSPMLEDKRHCVVMNGLDTNVFYRRDVSLLKREYSENRKIILFVTTFFSDAGDDLKGGRYVLELARRLESEDVTIVVAGRYDENLKYPSNMVMLGRVESQDRLAEYYSLADVTLLTSLRETFSMVTAESLCCGTPVVGFEAGGPETIALPGFSEFVPQGDVSALAKAVYEMLQKDFAGIDIAEKAQELYSGKRMVNEYIRIYRSMLEE